MKISKITKFLPIALALSLSIGSVYAADATKPQDNQTSSGEVLYELKLNDYVRITNEDSVTTATGQYDKDYAGMSLTGQMSANFKVITNDPRTVVLSAPSVATGSPSGLYDYKQNGGAHEFCLVFVNTSAGDVAATSVTSITGASGAATLAESPNAFGVKFEAAAGNVKAVHNLTGDGGSAGTITGAQTKGAGNITFTIPNGVSTFDFVSNSRIMQDTFNTRDREGTYQAKLILSDGEVLQ